MAIDHRNSEKTALDVKSGKCNLFAKYAGSEVGSIGTLRRPRQKIASKLNEPKGKGAADLQPASNVWPARPASPDEEANRNKRGSGR